MNTIKSILESVFVVGTILVLGCMSGVGLCYSIILWGYVSPFHVIAAAWGLIGISYLFAVWMEKMQPHASGRKVR